MTSRYDGLTDRLRPVLRHLDLCPRSGTTWRDEGDDWWCKDPIPECCCGQASVADRLFASDFEGALLEAEVYGVVDHLLRFGEWEWDGEATWDWYDRSVEVYIQNPPPSGINEDFLDLVGIRIQDLLGFSRVWIHPHGRSQEYCGQSACPLRPRRKKVDDGP